MAARPCPFYSQGKCVFADSCNFLHEEGNGNGPMNSFLTNVARADSMRTSYVNTTPMTPTTIQHALLRSASPRRSPRMSGLLMALQDVIGPTIDDGEDEEADHTFDEELQAFDGKETQNQVGSPTNSSGPSLTLVNNSRSISPASEDSGHGAEEEEEKEKEDLSVLFGSDDYRSDDDDQLTVRLAMSRRSTGSSLATATLGELSVPEATTEEEEASIIDVASAEPSRRSSLGLLSPVEVSIRPFLPFLRDPGYAPPIQREDSIDSGYADSWHEPTRLPLSPPQGDHHSSTPSIGLSFRYDSPSPVESNSKRAYTYAFPSVSETSSPHIRASPSPLGSISENAEDSLVESRHEESLKVDPQDVPLPFSPMSSPADVVQGEVTAAMGRSTPLDFLDRSQASFRSEDLEHQPQSSLDKSPLVDFSLAAKMEDETISSFYAEDRSAAERPESASILPYDMISEDELTEEETIPSFSAVDQSAEPESESSPELPYDMYTSPSREPTPDILKSAKRKWSAVVGELSMMSLNLQRLSSKNATPSAETQLLAVSPPTVSSTAPWNNTLDSVYEQHSVKYDDDDVGEGSSNSAGSSPRSKTMSLSPMSAPAGSFMVFTPPSVRGRTGSVGTLSPINSVTALSSPRGRLASQFREAFTPMSRKGKGKSPVQPGALEDQSWDAAGNVSTKAPFGFRYPYSLTNANAYTSSVVSQRDSFIPRSRSKLRITTDLENPDNAARPGTPNSSLAYLQSESPVARPAARGLKPLRLASAFNSRSASISSSLSHISLRDSLQSSMPHSPSVSSEHSLQHNSSPSSAHSSPISPIPQHIRNTLIPNHDIISQPQGRERTYSPASLHEPPLSAPLSHSQSWRSSPHSQAGSRNFSHPHRYSHSSTRLSQSTQRYDHEADESVDLQESFDNTIRNILPQAPHSAPVRRTKAASPAPSHAIATPPPTLLFAIASDDVAKVRRVLETGEAGPNDYIGPQSALAFTLTNDSLTNKMEIVKTLLAFGADPSGLKNPELNPPRRSSTSENGEPGTPQPISTSLEGMDPATRYYVARADAASTRRTSQLIHRSFFRPLTRVRYDLIGQDCALEQLFRVLSMHSQQVAVAPLVVMLCGPSGHGKSLLARKFGSLLDVPTHTVNMTTLRSTHDLWQSYSMSPYEEPTNSTLAQFLTENEGKRCVVVLDEIEKTEDEKSLWSLLMPWELGRCSPEAGKRHIDVQNVVWLGTSNIGHDLVFDYNDSREDPQAPTSRQEYIELMALLRPRVSARLGASLMSRVTTVLPFVPFSQDEKMAIAAEALCHLAGDTIRDMSPQQVEALVAKALPSYMPDEGARSLSRAISNQLVDCI